MIYLNDKKFGEAQTVVVGMVNLIIEQNKENGIKPIYTSATQVVDRVILAVKATEQVGHLKSFAGYLQAVTMKIVNMANMNEELNGKERELIYKVIYTYMMNLGLRVAKVKHELVA